MRLISLAKNLPIHLRLSFATLNPSGQVHEPPLGDAWHLSSQFNAGQLSLAANGTISRVVEVYKYSENSEPFPMVTYSRRPPRRRYLRSLFSGRTAAILGCTWASRSARLSGTKICRDKRWSCSWSRRCRRYSPRNRRNDNYAEYNDYSRSEIGRHDRLQNL